MPIIAPPNPESRQIGEFLTDLELRMKRAEAGLRAVQLGNSSLDGSGINMFDANGNYRGTVGFQEDGTTTVTSQNPIPPPVPSAPSVSPGIACLTVKHTGETADGSSLPADFSHLRVYLADAGIPDVKTLRGTINPVPGELVVTGLDYTNYIVDVTSVNLGGKESAHSAVSSGIPQMVVGQDILDGAITELHLSADSVTSAAIEANAVTTTKIADNSISTPKVIAGAINAGKIAVDSIQTSHLTAQAVTASKILALTITGNEIAANAITVGKLAAGSVTASKLEANLVVATRIIAGTDGGARIEMHPTAGLQGYQANGTTRTFWIDAATGNFSATGSIQTAFTGSRIVMNPGGTAPDTMRFYPSTGSQFASIDSITSGANFAGIMMYGASNVTSRGICIARQDYASLIFSDPNNLFGANLKTDIYAASNNARMRAYTVDLMTDVDQAGGDPHIGLMCTHGTSIISGTLLYFNDSGFSEPHFAAINRNVGITFGGPPQSGYNSRVWIVRNDVSQRADLGVYSIVYDGDVLKGSSRDIKDNIVPAEDLDPREAVRGARAKYFQNRYLASPPAYDAEGNEIAGSREAPVQLGMIAEEMPEQCVKMIPDAYRDGVDVLGINKDTMITMLWQGQGESRDQFDQYVAGPKWLPEMTILPDPPTSGATLYVFAGSVYAVLSTGKRVKIG
jgi:hypothetical protein